MYKLEEFKIKNGYQVLFALVVFLSACFSIIYN